MLFWPTVSVVGFVLLAAVVVALAQSSTARYEFERNQVQGQRRQAAVPAAVGAVAVAAPATAGVPAVPAPVGGGSMPEQAAPAGVANHPAGSRIGESGTPAWWLVDETEDAGPGQLVAGPFPDQVDADWAVIAGGLAATVRAVHGVVRPDGRLVRRQLPAERAWLAELGEQLDRLPEEWDSPLIDEDELVTLVVDVAAALVESGLPLHDCAGGAPAGGVCLSPEPGRHGIVVSWHQHDRMGREQVRGAAAHAVVQQAMNTAVAECLQSLGYPVEPFGDTGCVLVTVVPG
ncbi:hypothetical protein [uncultured Modestobacter sp.]|uniref:hypothetical protein n=1 Tax=uncultured Modestobacter sp. TaxID=380048 RepID=UPI00261D6704|nr:hypothetical protein [uncultured Modestobacter sp.]